MAEKIRLGGQQFRAALAAERHEAAKTFPEQSIIEWGTGENRVRARVIGVVDKTGVLITKRINETGDFLPGARPEKISPTAATPVSE